MKWCKARHTSITAVEWCHLPIWFNYQRFIESNYDDGPLWVQKYREVLEMNLTSDPKFKGWLLLPKPGRHISFNVKSIFTSHHHVSDGENVLNALECSNRAFQAHSKSSEVDICPHTETNPHTQDWISLEKDKASLALTKSHNSWIS